ncbi:MAG: hypothetical protein CME64_08570 [Halobacteriovoraceae bacterium]|nr:hypothetical protein [Halobacteriovoraceae bacterium]|tara:strand:- start:255596 stop:256489 length:894 start_codon:yes stop_codon:yes gene_type:complete
MKCPACEESLKTYKVKDFDGLLVEKCSGCEGLWFDDNELNLVLRNDNVLKELNTNGLKNLHKSKRTCPHCAIHLSSGLVGKTGILVENCSKCNGYFLDEGELKKLNLNRPNSNYAKLLRSNRRSLKRKLPKFFTNVLESDESVIWAEKPHLITYILGLAPISIIPGVVIGLLSVRGANIPGGAFLTSLLLALVIGVFIYINYKNVLYVLTSKRLIISTGFFGIDFHSIDYDKVTDLTVSVSVLQRIWGSGNIVFATASSMGVQSKFNKNIFRSVLNPYDVYRRVKRLTYNSDLEKTA